MKRFFCLLVVFMLTLICTNITVFAHPGKTDSAGGHYNRSTREYHYHHGYPAHQHPNGVCPYENKTIINNSGSSSIKNSNSSTYENSGIKSNSEYTTKKAESTKQETTKAEKQKNTKDFADIVSEVLMGLVVTTISKFAFPIVFFLIRSLIPKYEDSVISDRSFSIFLTVNVTICIIECVIMSLNKYISWLSFGIVVIINIISTILFNVVFNEKSEQ